MMFHVKHLLSISFLCFCFLAKGQGVYTYTPVDLTISLPLDTSINGLLNREVGIKSLSDYERALLYNLNYARVNPKAFLKYAVLPYLNAYPNLKPVYGSSLIAILSNLEKLPPLRIDTRIISIARKHAGDLAKYNQMRHLSHNGTTTQERFKQVGIQCGSECINMGSFSDPVEVVLSLLIDFGVPNFGHRKSLLNPAMKTVGLSTQKNAKGDMSYTVIDLGCD